MRCLVVATCLLAAIHFTSAIKFDYFSIRKSATRSQHVRPSGLGGQTAAVGHAGRGVKAVKPALIESRGLLADKSDDSTVSGSADSTSIAGSSSHPDVGLAHLYAPLSLTCHADCTKRGNCNIEEGRCECPFGYKGLTCEEPLMPACQMEPLGEPFWGMMIPRSCECARQANKFFGCTAEAATCRLSSFVYHGIRCYEFVGKPAGEQWSRMPLSNASGVSFFEGEVRNAVSLRPTLDPKDGVVGADIWSNEVMSLPLSECGHTECHHRGACILPLERANDRWVRERPVGRVPHCLCYKGYLGHTCGDSMVALCPNNCRNRGNCTRGFCHCDPPYFGLDCGRERAWQLAPGATPVPNRSRLRIYVYELPTNVASTGIGLDDNVHDLNEPSYQTHRKFLEMLLMDSAVRTENPYEANLFYVPALAYAYASNVNSPANQIAYALSYVQRRYPFFNTSGGRDHFVWTTGDQGSCHLPRNLSRVIHVTLFGLSASLRDGGETFVKPVPMLHPDYACFHPKKDVLAAPWYDHMAGSQQAPYVYQKVLQQDGAAPERDLLFFFAGSVRPNEPSYSGGVRQALALHLKELLGGGGTAHGHGHKGRHHGRLLRQEGAAGGGGGSNYSDVHFVEGYTPDYDKLYSRSRFCLAPHGHGFGVRLTLAATHACIPVIIQDQVYQPYEADGVLPYGEFALRLGKADIPHIVPILRAVPEARQRRMRLALAKYHKAFLWDRRLGGRAYDYTIAALEQRLWGLWGRLWRRQHRRR